MRKKEKEKKLEWAEHAWRKQDCVVKRMLLKYPRHNRSVYKPWSERLYQEGFHIALRFKAKKFRLVEDGKQSRRIEEGITEGMVSMVLTAKKIYISFIPIIQTTKIRIYN